jgi:hypothetical protein
MHGCTEMLITHQLARWYDEGTAGFGHSFFMVDKGF